MNILFITSSRIGDAVLSTGLLDHISRAHPQARVTIVCGPLCVSLFESYPNLERIIPLRKKPYNAHWFEIWCETVGTRWDKVVDLRNSIVSRAVWARRRHIYGMRIDRQRHKVEQNAQVMRLTPPPAPRLWFSDAQNAAAEKLIPQGAPVLAVGPTANWFAKMWPPENFIELIHRLTRPGGPMAGARVAIFAAPGEEDDARPVLDSIPEDRRIDVIAKADPSTAAAALARCVFYVGNDSGLMHCAAAAGVKTLGLFGPGFPPLYRPWGAHARFVKTPESFAVLTGYPGYDPKTAPCLMNTLTIDAAYAVAAQMLA